MMHPAARLSWLAFKIAGLVHHWQQHRAFGRVISSVGLLQDRFSQEAAGCSGLSHVSSLCWLVLIQKSAGSKIELLLECSATAEREDKSAIQSCHVTMVEIVRDKAPVNPT